MARHFLQLYLLIVAALAAVSWGQGKLWDVYSAQDPAAIAENQAQAAALSLVDERLRALPHDMRKQFVKDLAARTHVDLELFELRDIAGNDTLARLQRGELAYMRASDEDWLLKRVPDDGRVLALRYAAPAAQRGVLDWVLAFVFYAAIALVIMGWLWPLTRDLRQLERSTTTFGNRNWAFDARIGMRSPVYPLAAAFRRMAARIDSLIAAQKDMTNAMSHEIKTPLARMRFEVEMARMAGDSSTVARHLSHINGDIAELDAFVTATLDYAILERAEIALNIQDHDLTLILPALVDSFRRTAREGLRLRCEVSPTATAVKCDGHLLETVVRNLVYNAIRYARSEVQVLFSVDPGGVYNLCVNDDGPGIATADQTRVFDSFVQLDPGQIHVGQIDPGQIDPGQPDKDQLGTGRAEKGPGRKPGFGLGLAIVKRIVEWHGGTVVVTRAELGGAAFSVRWGPEVPG